MLDLHDTDFVRYMFGDPKAISSSGRIGATGRIDHILTQYQYDHIPMVWAEGGWCSTVGFNMTYTVYFENATAEDALRSVALFEAEVRSVETGAPVKFVP